METKYLIIILIVIAVIIILLLPRNIIIPTQRLNVYSSTLNSFQEVPSNFSTATGQGQALLSNDSSHLSYDYIIKDMIPRNAYFQRSRKGENGPIVKTLNLIPLSGAYRIAGTWTSSDQEPFNRSLSEDLKNGLIYINVTSDQFPEGEIRSQLIRPEL
jgi:hypothetical protein